MAKNFQVLVVDDDAVERMAVCQCLKDTDELIELYEASHCAEALVILQAQKLDCVFLDESLPDAQSLALLERLSAVGVEVPIVVLANEEDEKLSAQLLQAGASEYLSKAKLPVLLESKLANLIRLYRAEKQLVLEHRSQNIFAERYRLVLEVSRDVIWDWDIGKNQVFWNQNLLEFVGIKNNLSCTEPEYSLMAGIPENFAMPKSGCTWKEFLELFHPEDQQKLSQGILSHLDSQIEFNLELRVRHTSLGYCHCVTRGKALYDQQGNPLGVTGLISHIASDRQTETSNILKWFDTDEHLKNCEPSDRWNNLWVNSEEEIDSQFKITEKLRRAIAILGQQQQHLKTLQRLTNLLNHRLGNLSNLLQVMVQSVCDVIPKAQFSLLVLHNSQCNRLMLTVTAGIGTEKLRLEDAFGKGEGWLAKVASSGFSQDIQGRDDLPASVYAVPIESAQAGRLGLLAIGNWDTNNAFTQEEQKLLIAVGEQAAIAINNARVIKILEEREERLAVQNEILARQNQELENQREKIHLQNLQLLEATKLKSQFLATVSHELRTPMNAVIGFSQLLLRQIKNNPSDSQFSPKQMSMLERILNNGKHLLELINDILDFSKIEAGRMELQAQQFNLETLVRDCSEEVRILAEEKQINLEVIINLANPIIINDSDRLKQVLMNLLSNAIKFTSVGKVQIEVFEINSMQLAIRVTDTGIGIAEEHLKNIFEEFWQVNQSITKTHYGTGLGLAIIKSLVELMKGTVNVTSQLGEGSCFLVEIPRHISPLNYTNNCGKRLLK